MELYTKELLLRTVTSDDAAEVADMWAYPNGSISPGKAREVIAGMEETHKKNKQGNICHLCLAVYIKNEPRQIIGWCGLDGKAEPGKTVLFYVIAQQYRRRGYASQCAEELLRFAFEEMQYDRIDAGCEKGNTASYRILVKIGMKQEGVYENGDPMFFISKERYKEVGGLICKNMETIKRGSQYG
nr:GNAT family N-acetyltransferase [uncultured Eisenbergiella sp.]